MNTSKRHLAQELFAIAQVETHKLDSEKLGQLLRDFWRSLRFKLENVDLAETLLSITAGCAAYKNHYGYAPEDFSQRIFEVLSEANNLQSYLKTEGSEDALTWLSLSRATLYCDSEAKFRRKEFREVLSKWLEVEIPEWSPMTLDVTTGLLFGKIAWDLYGEDISTIQQEYLLQKIADNIYGAALPLQRIQRKNSADENVIVPNDIGS